LKAILAKEDVINKTREFSKIAPIDGLDSIEVIALAAICENLDSSDDHVTPYQIKIDMDRAGFTTVATNIALRLLSKRGLIKSIGVSGFNSDPYTGYQLTDSGWDWILENKNKFALSKPKKDTHNSVDDDLPF